MEIKSISKKIFRETPQKIENNSAHTNPFGVNFKGNMISADVFETSKPKVSFKGTELAGKIAEKTAGARRRLQESALVGSLGNVSKAISTRLNTVAEFGKKVGESAVRAWNYVTTYNLKLELPAFDFSVAKKTTQDLFKITKSQPEARTTNKIGDELKAHIAAWEKEESRTLEAVA